LHVLQITSSFSSSRFVKTFTAEDAEKFLKSDALKSFPVYLPLATTHNPDKPYPKA
jgi:hypothetical protein